MATEIELKLPFDDLDTVRQRLKLVGAVSRGERFETNVFFDTSERTLKAQGRGLRLRSMRSEAGEVSNVITLKGPASGDAVRSREEIEFSVGSFKDATTLLDRLGYRQTLGFEKRRETWELGPCLIELDSVPHLGRFVEIEAPSEADVNVARAQLGLDQVASEQRGYISMINALVGQRPELGPIVRF
jgi:predicted adenylyl cyclase CyaB